jgi:hypothetical protein
MKDKTVRSLEEIEVAGTNGEELTVVVAAVASAASEVRWSMISR